jgi:hypothetical protein
MGKQSSRTTLRDAFLRWQCRLRRIAMREHGGKPSPGMRPRVLHRSGREIAPALTMVLVPKAPEESTAFFRFQVLKTQDPREAYERGLTFLQADYFQEPEAFSDRLVAILAGGSEIAAALLSHGACVLHFEEAGQSYDVPSAVSELVPGEAAREAAIWHNRLFNPALPDALHVLLFQPDWASAAAIPSPDGRRTQSA